MQNSPINHTDLDNAIKDSLLNSSPKVGVEWEEIERSLPQKSTTVKSPLVNFNYSLNSFTGFFAFTSFVNWESVALFVKKWSVALSVISGGLAIAVGAYLFYEPSTTLPTTSPSATTEIQNSDLGNNGVTDVSTQPTTSFAVNPTITFNETIEETTGNDEPLIDIVSKTTVEESTQAVTEPPTNTEEITTLKTEQSEQVNNTEKTSTPVETAVIDSNTEADNKTNASTSGKILYYKESLSLDRLEQQISDGKGQNKQDSVLNKATVNPE